MKLYIIVFLTGLVFGLLFKAKIGLNIENVTIYDNEEDKELLNKIKERVDK